jgi:predicted transcriptional regulator of viral defense system
MNRKSKTKPPMDLLMALAKGGRLVRVRDAAAIGIARTYLQLAVARSLLERAGRGVYRSPHAEATEHRTLAEVCARVPRGVLCLLTALRFHEIGTQNPPDVWLAIGPKAHRPALGQLRLQVVRFSGPALAQGVETHVIEGVRVRVTNPAKTVADCFKYRNKVGLDVAIEALKDVWRRGRCTADDLMKYARTCRVARVMRPYMEAIA